MITKIAFHVGGILLTYIIQTGLLINLPRPINLLSLPVIMVVMVTYVFGLSSGFAWALSLGLLLDYNAALWPGSTLLAFALTVVLIKILSDNVFTNRSLYSNSLLCLIGTIFQQLIVYLLNFKYFNEQAGLENAAYSLLWRVVLNILLSGFIFTILGYFYKELKSYILNE